MDNKRKEKKRKRKNCFTKRVYQHPLQKYYVMLSPKEKAPLLNSRKRTK